MHPFFARTGCTRCAKKSKPAHTVGVSGPQVWPVVFGTTGTYAFAQLRSASYPESLGDWKMIPPS